MKLMKNKKGQAITALQGTILGIVIVVATLGVGYAVITNLAAPYLSTSNGTTYQSINAGITHLNTVKDNLGIIVTIAVFTVVLSGIAAFGLFRASR